eukprot:6036025-Ditylum_brightwellii.AAC.1
MPATMLTVEEWAEVTTNLFVTIGGAMMVEMEDLSSLQQQQIIGKKQMMIPKQNQMRVCGKNNIICKKRKMEV